MFTKFNFVDLNYLDLLENHGKHLPGMVSRMILPQPSLSAPLVQNRLGYNDFSHLIRLTHQTLNGCQ